MKNIMTNKTLWEINLVFKENFHQINLDCRKCVQLHIANNFDKLKTEVQHFQLSQSDSILAN